MNSFTEPSFLKRRKFFGVGATSLLALLVTPKMLPRVFRAAEPSVEHGDSVTVRRNPLAVPRSAKGSNPNE